MKLLITKYITSSPSFVGIAMLIAFALGSCASEPTPPSDDAGKLTFRVIAPKNAASPVRSGATWGDLYEEEAGNDFETALLDGQVHAYITSSDCRKQYGVTDLLCTKFTENSSIVIYDYIGKIAKEDLEELKGVTDGKLHIIANNGYQASLDSEIQFSLSGQPGDDFKAIPMWGVTKADYSGLKPNSTLKVGDINLLRSMAKVEIVNSTDEFNYIDAISSVTVSKVNTKGYLLPMEWTSTEKTDALSRHSANIPTQTPDGPVTYTPSDGKLEFYLPEILNGEEEITLAITCETEIGKMTGNLYFRDYSGGKPTGAKLDVLRNYLYRFTVRRDADGFFGVEVNVLPWVVRLNNVEF